MPRTRSGPPTARRQSPKSSVSYRGILRTVRLLAAGALAAGLLAACGDDGGTTAETGAQQAATTTTAAGPTTAVTAAPARTFTSETTSNDGVRFRITVNVGERGSTAVPGDCSLTLARGVPVSLVITNLTDRTAPFPPLRVEQVAPGGGSRDQVQVRDPSGTCTFTPRVPSIGPNQTITFQGAAPAPTGQIEVSISETRFTLVAPLP